MPELALPHLLGEFWQALLMAFMMLWATFWSLMLGLILSAVIQVIVPKEKIAELLGGAGFKEIARATFFGAASSSCSYAATAMAKTLFAKGAHLIAVLAFMFASTNLVIELSFVLWNLLGPVFVLAEIVGGLLLVLIMTLLVKLTYPKHLVDSAKGVDEHAAHDHKLMMSVEMVEEPKLSWQQKLTSRNGWTQIAQAFVMDWQMLRKEVLIGFLIAGFIGVFVPASAWQVIFVQNGPAWFKILENGFVGPVIAILSFVCSIGNIPMAAVLWSNGISFGGVISFIFADLLVLPIVKLYGKYYGWRLAIYISTVLFVTMVLSGIVVDLLFGALGIIPVQRTLPLISKMQIEFNYTFVLNILFLVLALTLGYLAKGKPSQTGESGDCCH
jgi:uncharacterized membrane protein YraQ (UPF0718 family)